MSGRIEFLFALVEKYGNARVLEVIAALQAERAAAKGKRP